MVKIVASFRYSWHMDTGIIELTPSEKDKIRESAFINARISAAMYDTAILAANFGVDSVSFCSMAGAALQAASNALQEAREGIEEDWRARGFVGKKKDEPDGG